jgi:hypothetical protein
MSWKHLIVAVPLAAALTAPSFALAEEVPESALRLIPSLQQWGQDPVLVAAVNQQNAQGKSLDEIKKTDAEWMATTGVNEFMSGLMSNEAATELKKLEGSAPYYTELFLMDNQGANVAMSNKTSDYWQGDEPKFTESFKGGQGAVHVGGVKFDDSAQAYLVQISVPVLDGGQAIGALTVGLNLDELEQAGK